MSRFLLTGCSQVACFGRDGALSLVCPGAVLLEGGRVAKVGSEAEFEGYDGPVHDVGGRVVTPGLVDCHTHLAFGGHRGRDLELRAQGLSYAEIAERGGGIASTVEATRRLGDTAMADVVARRVRSALRLGTTTLEAKSGYGLDYETERRILLAYRRTGEAAPATVVPTYLGLHAVPLGRDKAGYVRECVEETLPALHSEGLADGVDAFVEPGYFSPEDAEALATAARRLGLALRLHVDQFGDHGGAALAARLGAASADHLEHTGSEGIAVLAGSSTVPVLLPGSVLGLGLGRYPDARAMLAAGLPVALATDFNPGSSPVLSLPTVMGLACRTMGMSPAEALAGCTVHAARALGLSDRGRLVPGERADIAVWDAADYRELGVYYGVPLCREVFVAGERFEAGA